MKRNLVLIYSLWAIPIIVLLLIFKFFPSSGSVGILSLIFGFAFFLLPGWLINHFLKVKVTNLLGQILIYFVFSLGYYLILNILAMLVGFCITTLLWVYLFMTIIIFVGAIIYDFRTKQDYVFKFKFDKSQIIYLVPIAICGLILLFVDGQGANFNGDPYYHLAIIRKAVEGMSLTPLNLVYTQSTANNPAYVLPAWHLIVAAYSKITGTDIFTAWSKINLSLLVLCFLSFFYFIRTIVLNKILLITTFVVSIFFLFYAGPGYFFERLTVPDTFAQFVLLPLVLVFSLIYIFENNKKILFPIALLVISLLDIHAIHYFYYFFILILLGIIFSIVTLFKDKENIKSIWKLVGLNLIIGILLGIILELKGGFTSSNLESFSSAPNLEITYPAFKYFQITFKIGLIFLPFILLFSKNRRILLIFSSFLLAPLIYWTPLKDIFTKLLSFIFTDRLLGNVAWYYIVIGILLGGIYLGVEKIFEKSKFKNALLISGGILTLLVIILESVWKIFSNLIYNIFFSTPTLEQDTSWALPVFIFVVIVTTVFLLAQKYSKLKILDFVEKNNTYYIVLVSIITFIIFYPVIFPDFAKGWNLKVFSKYGISSAGAATLGLYPEGRLIPYIRENIPQKSTILANPATSKNISIFVDDYVVYNQGTTWATKFKNVFNGEFDADTTKELILDPKYKTDYLILSPTDRIKDIITSDTRFKLVFDEEVSVYKVVK